MSRDSNFGARVHRQTFLFKTSEYRMKLIAKKFRDYFKRMQLPRLASDSTRAGIFELVPCYGRIFGFNFELRAALNRRSSHFYVVLTL